MIKDFYNKHKKLVNVSGMIILGSACIMIGRKIEIMNTDNGLIHIGDTGEQLCKKVGNIEYTVTVTKELINL